MSNRQDIAEAIEAQKIGKRIEFRIPGHKEWNHYTEPFNWWEGYEYRVIENPPPCEDINVEEVREKLRQRGDAGLRKYGVTTERADLTRKQWLIHAQEEALDLAVYLQRLINDEP